MVTALYRRYRPESFADVIGQDHVTTPLMRALRSGRIGHAYLFSGPRGCGKTTSARILARCLNCAEGPTDTPCGQCDSCRDLARGGPGSLDVVEIDAASHGGVDDARELRERATFAPARDRYKVFIIDEAHMVTSAGFNALLKLVEEPPEHVKFVFATTEPDKVIGTIRSRTHHYPFRLIPPQVLTPYLEQLCASEGVEVGPGVLPLVVRAGGGSARDTLSVLDQLMAGAGEEGVDQATATALLGFTDAELLDRTIAAIGNRDAASLYGAIEQVLASGHEPRRFVEDLLERLRDLIVLSAVPDRGEELLPQLPSAQVAELRDQIIGFEPADLSRCGDLVHETLSTMSGATSPRLHLELLAARLALRDERAGARVAEQAAPNAARAGGRGAGEPGRDRGLSPRERAQQQVQTSRRPRPDRAEDPAVPTPPGRGVTGRPGAPAADEAAPVQGASTAPDTASAAAPSAAPTAASTTDDDWGPVAPVGGGRATASSPPAGEAADAESTAADAEPTQPVTDGPEREAPAGERAAESTDDVDLAAPLHGGVVPHPVAEEAAGPSTEERAPQADAPSGSEGPQSAVDSASQPAAGSGDLEEMRGYWSGILDELQQVRRASWALISQNAQLVDLRGDDLVLGFRSEGLVAAFYRGPHGANLAEAVRRVMRRTVTVEAIVAEGPAADDAGPSAASRPEGGGGGGGRPRDRAGNGDGARGGRSPHADAAPRRGEGQGRAAGRPVPRGAQEAPLDSDVPPEPDDPYPPDPLDAGGGDPYDHAPAQPAPDRDAPAEPAPAQQVPARDAPAERAPAHDALTQRAPAREAGREEQQAAETVSVGGAGTTDDGIPEPLVIPDDSRDDLPEDVPRTHGQVALRTALESGRPVRTEPREATSRPAVAATGASAVPTTQAPTTQSPTTQAPTTQSPATQAPATPTAAPEPSPAESATEEPSPTRAAPAQATPAERPVSRSDESPVASPVDDGGWGDVPVVRPGGMAPQPVPAPEGESSASRSREDLGPRGRAAAVRPGGAPSAAPPGAAPSSATPPADDPTGGASRDDEDAAYTARRPQELIETLLGGQVLEIIDQTR